MLNKIYYGWKVHAATFFCALIVVGTTSYVFGLFVIPVSESLNLSRAGVNNGFIAFLVGVALFSPLCGRLLDRVPARWLIACGGLIFGLGMIAIAMTDNPLLMLLSIVGPVSFGFATCGTLAANTVVVRWFSESRGIALGTLAVSTSLGGFICTPIVALLIENFGWRSALLATGTTAAIMIPALVLVFVRDRPTGTEAGYDKEFNTTPQTTDSTGREMSGSPRKSDEPLWNYADLFRNRNFWLVSIAITLLFASDQALIVAQIPHLQDSGISVSAAAAIASFMAMSAILGKVLVGYMADKINLRWVFVVVAVAHMILLATYMVMPGYWVLFVLAVTFGIGIGGVYPVWSTLLAWLFGSRSYGTIMGLMTIPMKLSGAIAVRFVGEMHDRTGSYMAAFVLFVIMIALSVILIFLVRSPDRQPTPALEQA